MNKTFTIADGNKYYNRKSSGFNPCIIGNFPFNSSKRTGIKGKNVLPNCVGFATGRFNELLNAGSCKWLGNTDAKNFVNLAKSQGLKIGKEPKKGACIVWTNNKYGHVAIVEEVVSPSEIIVSQSGWSYRGGDFWMAKHRKGAGNWIEGDDAGWMGGYKFLGFIYPPEIEKPFDKDIKMLYNGNEVICKGVYNKGTNYIRLRDIDEVLKLAKIGYDAEKKMPVITKEK